MFRSLPAVSLSGCIRVLSVAAFLVVCGRVSAESHTAGKSRILMLTQSSGYIHDSVRRPEKELAVAEVAMMQIAETTELFTVDCTQDAAADVTRDNLQNYDIVMFYTTGALPIAEADLNYFLNEWLSQERHGFIGVHSATDTLCDNPAYWEMVGGSFNGHPWNAGTTVTISVHEPDHPTMQPFGTEFTIRDEIYQYRNWQPEKVRVLMSLNMEKTLPAVPQHVPVAWVKSWGNGRVYVNNLGHNASSWSDPRYRNSLANAVRWIRGDVPGTSKPNPELSTAQQKLAVSVAPKQ